LLLSILLGAGTYGRVYRVHDPDLHCYRAAKIPTDLVLANADLRGEFLSEARKLQKIDDHPNVVRVVQAGEMTGTVALLRNGILPRPIACILAQK